MPLQRAFQTAFVSDTYFEEDHLRAILPRTPHLIVNSCRYRKPKALGLHAELTRQTGWKAARSCISATTGTPILRHPANWE
jgi:hypothetical protein